MVETSFVCIKKKISTFCKFSVRHWHFARTDHNDCKTAFWHTPAFALAWHRQHGKFKTCWTQSTSQILWTRCFGCQIRIKYVLQCSETDKCSLFQFS